MSVTPSHFYLGPQRFLHNNEARTTSATPAVYEVIAGERERESCACVQGRQTEVCACCHSYAFGRHGDPLSHPLVGASSIVTPNEFFAKLCAVGLEPPVGRDCLVRLPFLRIDCRPCLNEFAI